MKATEDLFAGLFINYLIEGDLQEAERILDKADFPLQKYSFRESPVHIAVSRGDVVAVDFLFRKGFNLNEVDLTIHEGTVVHRCAADGNTQMLSYLLDKRNYMDLDALDAMGRTPLHIACMRGHAGIAHALIDVGVTLVIKDKDCKPPRYYADTRRLASVAARLPPFKYDWESTARRKLEEARANLQPARDAVRRPPTTRASASAPACSSNHTKQACKHGVAKGTKRDTGPNR